MSKDSQTCPFCDKWQPWWSVADHVDSRMQPWWSVADHVDSRMQPWWSWENANFNAYNKPIGDRCVYPVLTSVPYEVQHNNYCSCCGQKVKGE